jgi:hypothetical protein
MRSSGGWTPPTAVSGGPPPNLPSRFPHCCQGRGAGWGRGDEQAGSGDGQTGSANGQAGSGDEQAEARKRGAAVSMLELRGVSKVYGTGAGEVQALRDVGLSVEAGAMVAVMGPSGSGKSTLLTIAGSLEEPSSGEVLVDGAKLSGMSRNDKARLRRRTVGYVFQRFQPAGRADRGRERLPAAGARRDGRQEGPRGRPAGAGRAGPGRARVPVSRRAVGGRAPAGGDRARRGGRPPPAARR